MWGAEKSIGQRTFTDILVDAAEGTEQTILSADTQGEFAQYERSWERLLDLYGDAAPGEERARLFEAMEELMAEQTPEDGDVTSAAHDLLAQRDLPRPDYEPAEPFEH
ncbi:hypothetical protein LRS73_04350 [Methylobacterium currus]|uniref:hypothetical protein n=1 Tax=Methylobacterium currus TaxID=2051553 RepID=UPI001E379FF4|nr:hypothetical protein [Methylobacterium currus]UHC17152.1 hypothetical protein LRS73_04350 [Methylobacterium currus]